MTAGLADLLTASPSLAPMAIALKRAAASDAPILIVGEPGAGRTSLARALHAESPRASSVLLEVDPGVVPSTLFESEFFGYRKGAFTGASESARGRVERADGGTLLLDHVEELPLTAQPKLLRLLAERRFAPLAGDEREVDVRFIALGSSELPHRVRQGAFREDLYYRLEVLAFRLPPLRERREDLGSLIETLLEDLRRRYDRRDVALADAARDWMLSYDWPGNLRQLRNVLERALILHTSGPLSPKPPRDARSLRPRSLAEVEREAIVEALAHTRGHQSRAAELLGISRKALWQKRRRHDIP